MHGLETAAVGLGKIDPQSAFRKMVKVVVSSIFYFHPYLGKIPISTNIFQVGNHQLVVLLDQTIIFRVGFGPFLISASCNSKSRFGKEALFRVKDLAAPKIRHHGNEKFGKSSG